MHRTARGAWREGGLIVLEGDAELPPRCIFCNGPQSVRILRQFSWHSPWLYLLIPLLLVYLLVAWSVRQRALIEVPLCHSHDRVRLAKLWSTWALALIGVALSFSAPREGSPGYWLSLGTCALLAALVVATSGRLRAKRIEGLRTELRGAGRAFLANLPTASFASEARRGA